MYSATITSMYHRYIIIIIIIINAEIRVTVKLRVFQGRSHCPRRWREYSARAHFGSTHSWVFRAAEWLWSGLARFRGNPERRRDIKRGLYTRRLACSSGGHHRHWTLRPPPATMVVVATTAYTNLRDVRLQMLAVLRPGRFPYRPASIYIVRRPFPQRPRQRRTAVRFHYHWAAWPTDVRALCDLPSTSVVLMVRRWMSYGEAERSASGESRPPRRSTRFFLLIGRHCVVRSASRLLWTTATEAAHVLDRARWCRPVTSVSTVAVLRWTVRSRSATAARHRCHWHTPPPWGQSYRRPHCHCRRGTAVFHAMPNQLLIRGLSTYHPGWRCETRTFTS